MLQCKNKNWDDIICISEEVKGVTEQKKEEKEREILHYDFADEAINAVLAELHQSSCHMVRKYKTRILLLKIFLILSGVLLTLLLEYMMFISLWYRDTLFKFIMIFTPVLAGVIGYAAASIIDSTFDLKYGLFNNEFQYAYENKFIYTFTGFFQSVHSDEALWTNIVAGDMIWRVRNKILDFQSFEGKEVLLLLTRNFFDDDVDFECIYVKEI